MTRRRNIEEETASRTDKFVHEHEPSSGALNNPATCKSGRSAKQPSICHPRFLAATAKRQTDIRGERRKDTEEIVSGWGVSFPRPHPAEHGDRCSRHR